MTPARIRQGQPSPVPASEGVAMAPASTLLSTVPFGARETRE
jgi:hypothetical protein